MKSALRLICVIVTVELCSAHMYAQSEPDPAGQPRTGLGGRRNVLTAAATNSIPTVKAMSPEVSNQGRAIYNFQFSDLDGWQDLNVTNILINSSLDGRSACYLAYVRSSNILYIVADDGDGNHLSGKTMDGTGTVSNSQCTIYLGTSNAAGSGNDLTLTLDIGFSAAFATATSVYATGRLFYLAAGDSAAGNSGWQSMGVHRNTVEPASYPRPVNLRTTSRRLGCQQATMYGEWRFRQSS